MTTDPARALLDELNERLWVAYAGGSADVAVNNSPVLLAALYAMLDLADQLDRDAENTPIGYLTVYARSAADHIRAAVTAALTPKPTP